VKLETDEGGMGYHDDLLMCQKFLQLRRLHEQSQPWKQLDEVTEEIMELMIQSANTINKENLNKKKEATLAGATQKQ
jgi:hypothetical protein